MNSISPHHNTFSHIHVNIYVLIYVQHILSDSLPFCTIIKFLTLIIPAVSVILSVPFFLTWTSAAWLDSFSTSTASFIYWHIHLHLVKYSPASAIMTAGCRHAERRCANTHMQWILCLIKHVSAGAVHAVRLLTLEKHPEGCSVVLHVYILIIFFCVFYMIYHFFYL